MEGLSCLTWIPTKDLVRRTISEVSTECASVFSRSLGVSLGFHCVAVSCMVTITTKSQGSLCLDTQELLVAIWPHSFSGMCRKSFLQVYWECVETPQTDTVFVRNSFLSPMLSKGLSYNNNNSTFLSPVNLYPTWGGHGNFSVYSHLVGSQWPGDPWSTAGIGSKGWCLLTCGVCTDSGWLLLELNWSTLNWDSNGIPIFSKTLLYWFFSSSTICSLQLHLTRPTHVLLF